MKTYTNSPSTLLRLCCLFMLGLGFMLASQTALQAQVTTHSPQTISDIQSDIQSALNKLPNTTTTNRLKTGSKKLVNDTRTLYQEGLGFQSMSSSQQNDYVNRLNANSQTVTATARVSCVQTCANERNACILSACGPNTSWPCFCCVPCNLLFDLCIFDCLVDIEIGIKIGK